MYGHVLSIQYPFIIIISIIIIMSVQQSSKPPHDYYFDIVTFSMFFLLTVCVVCIDLKIMCICVLIAGRVKMKHCFCI